MPNLISSEATVAPCGSWRSPIDSDLIVGESIELVDVWLDGKNVYWCEGRPKENGRRVVVRQRGDGTMEDLTPPHFNARTRVHEYGGGAALIHDGVVYFSNFDDQRLYRLQAGEAVPLPVGQKTSNAGSMPNLRLAFLSLSRQTHPQIIVKLPMNAIL